MTHVRFSRIDLNKNIWPSYWIESQRQFVSFDRQRYEKAERIGQINDCDSFWAVVESRDERRRMIDCQFRRRYVGLEREWEGGGMNVVGKEKKSIKRKTRKFRRPKRVRAQRSANMLSPSLSS